MARPKLTLYMYVNREIVNHVTSKQILVNRSCSKKCITGDPAGDSLSTTFRSGLQSLLSSWLSYLVHPHCQIYKMLLMCVMSDIAGLGPGIIDRPGLLSNVA